MQVIGPTFAAYHVAGTSNNLLDPLANIAAAINYARARYGPTLMSGGMGMGSGHGYASGTSGAAPGWAWVGERGPELVRFSGGEHVLPAGLSGYAAGTGLRGYATGTSPEAAAFGPLLAAARAEMNPFWQLMSAALPKTTPAAQRAAFASWKKALQKQQLTAIGLGRKPPGALEVITSQATPAAVTTDQWSAFTSSLAYLTREFGGIGVPGGINPPGTPRDSGWAAWHYQHGLWQSTLDALRKLQGAAGAFPWGVTHTYGGDVANTPGAVLAAALGPFTGPALNMDKGGWLPPGLSSVYNGTGRPEAVGGAGGPVRLEVSPGGGSDFERFMATMIKRYVKIRGAGDVQTAFGAR